MTGYARKIRRRHAKTQKMKYHIMHVALDIADRLAKNPWLINRKDLINLNK